MKNDADFERCERHFTQLSRAWYGKYNLPEGQRVEVITIGFYDPEGGTIGEFQINWRHLGGELVPRLEVFNDSWNALSRFPELLEWMREMDDENVTPEQVCDFLRSIGVRDATKESQGDSE